MSRTKDSLLFFSLCGYLTGAFLNSSTLDTTSALAVQNAQTETLQRLRNAVAQLDMLTRTKVEDILMAIIPFGLNTNWDGSNSPSIFHYNAAVRLYMHACGHGTPCPRPGDHQELFLHTLVYWWMGLAFVTDTTKECLLEPPPLEIGIGNDSETANSAKRIPHPLAGVADEFADVGDIETPVQDLINTAEVYRPAALILLYRAFPDLLNGRLRLDENEADAGQSAKERRLLWVTALAIRALNILRQNAPRSGTRSIEPILLVIIAGELQKRTCSQISSLTDESDGLSLGPSIAGCSPPSPLPTSSFDHFTALHGLAGHDSLRSIFDSHFCESSGPDRIDEARRTLLQRLQSIR
ncbi:uncharacterized protein Z520_10886 [Fonsecaea multimorphosa CBS 102226]|uniref:Transcription factor domain-containing protein n=1 Tax=Fonsecaea multimorphosa CBS 102226 TaxID=1442371 RepID=A0A0D2I8F8_9EURO|nr:uncharacterized protein Z520_10886 [Fonsecaea multimorphosa CBS 102226]KIX93466.1 hypothetical protein Z520_10886 [Fonsecaea multimorphosa CBS 102226]